MKRKFWWVLAVLIPLGLFLAARQANAEGQLPKPPSVSEGLLSRDGSTLVTRYGDGEMQAWKKAPRGKSFRLLYRWSVRFVNNLVEIAPDGKLLAVRRFLNPIPKGHISDTEWVFWSLTGKKPRLIWAKAPTRSTWMSAVNTEQDVQILEVPYLEIRARNGKIKRRVKLQGKFVGGSNGLGAISADGRIVATSSDVDVQVFATQTGRLLKKWKTEDPIGILWFASSGYYLTAQCNRTFSESDGMAREGGSYRRIWNAKTGQLAPKQPV